jgi:hypothetical protein
MQVRYTDYNGSDTAIAASHRAEWTELEQVLGTMPLHLKASDQAGLQGNAIFDPVGTNAHIADGLVHHQWRPGIAIPAEFAFLGTGIDFGKRGMVVEVQFSNYPFLLNNTIRSELFFRSQTVFDVEPTRLIVIVTKAGMFPSSNSTLYYEQAVRQLNALAHHGVFTVPIRLVGLFETVGRVQATWTSYSAARYSRTVDGVRATRSFIITARRGERCRLEPEITASDL